jgi:hypothetical protein
MPEGIQVFVIEGQNSAHNAMSAVSGTDPGVGAEYGPDTNQ